MKLNGDIDVMCEKSPHIVCFLEVELDVVCLRKENKKNVIEYRRLFCIKIQEKSKGFRKKKAKTTCFEKTKKTKKFLDKINE